VAPSYASDYLFLNWDDPITLLTASPVVSYGRISPVLSMSCARGSPFCTVAPKACQRDLLGIGSSDNGPAIGSYVEEQPTEHVSSSQS
jgi:hypothetical protein